MKVEILLLLGKHEPGLRKAETLLDIRTVFRDVQEVEALVESALVTTTLGGNAATCHR